MTESRLFWECSLWDCSAMSVLCESNMDGRGGRLVFQLLRGGTLFSWVLPPRAASACSGKGNGQELEPAENSPDPKYSPASEKEFRGI